MSLQDVKNDILREARNKAQRIEEEAEEEKQEILKKAEEKAEEIKEEAEEELEEEKEAERRKVVSNARMKARQEKLKAKQEKISEVFNNFSEKLRNLDGDERQSFVENAVEEADFNVGKVKAGEKFEEAVDERKMDFEKADIEGFILVSEDEERSKDFTVEKVVEDFKNRYRKQVADELFGETEE